MYVKAVRPPKNFAHKFVGNIYSVLLSQVGNIKERIYFVHSFFGTPPMTNRYEGCVYIAVSIVIETEGDARKLCV
tara:strand:- start:728 stop:952 length:225 start_codon:yes stop_codon:yes gene_type:complete